MIERLADDEECVEDGQPMLWADDQSIAHTPFLEALGVWVSCQKGAPMIQDAAKAFNATEECIRAAVDRHYWLFELDGKIEQEGL